MRYDESGKLIEKFILNNDPYSKSKILLAGKNFGCGSSREHAPWALLDFGIRCVISSSFADIFYNNCFKNGILPIKIDEKIVFESVGKLMTTSDFLPTLSKVINYCIESKLKSNGIPNVNYAYKEACHSRNNFEKFTWSHPIIFYIGSKTGWDYLWTQAEKETFREFKLNYDILVNEYLEGKEFSEPNFPKLPNTLEVKVDRKSQLKKIQDLKN